PLLSRSLLLTLEPLTDADIRAVVSRALTGERGLAGAVTLAADAEDHLVKLAGGDARRALTYLESAALGLAAGAEIGLASLERAVDRAAVRYDRDGDQHYDVISAFIKSIRGSDADAALHYLARMIEAGEDPRFIARRIIVHASEDVGMADPSALGVAGAAGPAGRVVRPPPARVNPPPAPTPPAPAPPSTWPWHRSPTPWSKRSTRPGRTSGRARAARCPPTSAMPATGAPRGCATARVTSTRTTPRRASSPSSTRPTPSRAASTTSPPGTALRPATRTGMNGSGRSWAGQRTTRRSPNADTILAQEGEAADAARRRLAASPWPAVLRRRTTPGTPRVAWNPRGPKGPGDFVTRTWPPAHRR